MFLLYHSLNLENICDICESGFAKWSCTPVAEACNTSQSSCTSRKCWIPEKGRTRGRASDGVLITCKTIACARRCKALSTYWGITASLQLPDYIELNEPDGSNDPLHLECSKICWCSWQRGQMHLHAKQVVYKLINNRIQFQLSIIVRERWNDILQFQ